MPKKRILFVSHVSSLGGAVFSMLANLRRINREDYDIAVVVPGRGPFPDILKKNGIRTYVIPIHSFYYCSLVKSFSVKSLPEFLRSLKNLIELIPVCIGNIVMLPMVIRKERPDLIVLNSSAPLLSGIIAKLMNKRVVWHVREIIDTEKSAVIKKLIASIINFSGEKVIALSEYSYGDLRKIGVRNIAFIPAGVDLRKFSKAPVPDLRFKELGLKPTDKIIGYMCQIYDAKGWRNLVKAAFLVTQTLPDVKFLIVGSENMKKGEGNAERNGKIPRKRYGSALHRAVDGMRLSGNFVFLGQRLDVDKLLNVVDCAAVISSVPEPLQRIILEAFASGAPVIASNKGGAREIIRDGVNGLLVEANNSKELAGAMVKILGDHESAGKIGGMGRKTAEDRFDIEKIVPKLLKIYFPQK